MVEEFDGATTVPSVIPNKVQVWIQIHKIPRTETILKQLASMVGEVDKVEMKVVYFRSGEFHRARVKLNAESPLLKGVCNIPNFKTKRK
jgi:UDP-N-acetylmuramate-alanine ligase